MANQPLRGCPTCLTPVAETKLGLRDYRWLSDYLPGKVAPMDFDGVLERNGHFLILEFKPEGVRPRTGQARTLRAARKWADVWLVQGDGPVVKVDFGDGEVFAMSVESLAVEVRRWFDEAGAS